MTLSVNGQAVRQVGFPKVADSCDARGTTSFADVPLSGRDPVVALWLGYGA